MSRTIRHRAHRNSPHDPSAGPADRRDAAAAAEFARRLRETLARMLLDSSAERDADPAPLTVPRAWTALGPAQLASAHPGTPVDRLKARALYERCLTHYRQQVRPEDLAGGLDDLGAALARFVAANFEALNGAQATRGMLARLERQLVGIVRRSPAWSAAGVQERQAYFEQLALLSVLVAESAALAVRQGVAALDNVQRAASGYLRQLVGLDPDGLMLSPDGLALRWEPPEQECTAAAAAPKRVPEPA